MNIRLDRRLGDNKWCFPEIMITLDSGVPRLELPKRCTIELPGEDTGVDEGLSRGLGRDTLKRT
jgi:hypothetical protein